MRVESFLAALGDDDASMIHEALHDFVSICKSGELPIADAYAKVSPSGIEIFNVWDTAGSLKKNASKALNESSITAASLEALASLLLTGSEISSNAKRLVVKRSLQRANKLHAFLSSSRDNILVKSVFTLLMAIAGQGSAVCRELTTKMNLNNSNIIKHVNKGDDAKTQITRFGSVRYRCIKLVISLLYNSDVNVKKRMLERNGFVSNIFPKIAKDPVELVAPFLDALVENVLKDHGVGLRMKSGFFNPSVVSSIVSLYKTDKREIAHRFLTTLFIESSTRVFTVMGHKHAANSIKCLHALTSSLNPVDDEFHYELVLGTLGAFPELVSDYFRNEASKITAEPRPSFRWFTAALFLCEILKLPIDRDGNFGIEVPGCVTKSMLTRGLQHSNTLIVVHILDLLGHVVSRWSRLPAKDRLGLEIHQHLPDVNVLQSILHVKKETWEQEEFIWIRLRAIRVLLGYTRLQSDLVLGKVDYLKILGKEMELERDADRHYVFSIMQCIQEIGPHNISWVSKEQVDWIMQASNVFNHPLGVAKETIMTILACDAGTAVDCLLQSMNASDIASIVWNCRNQDGTPEMNLIRVAKEFENFSSFVFLLIHSDVDPSTFLLDEFQIASIMSYANNSLGYEIPGVHLYEPLPKLKQSFLWQFASSLDESGNVKPGDEIKLLALARINQDVSAVRQVSRILGTHLARGSGSLCIDLCFEFLAVMLEKQPNWIGAAFCHPFLTEHVTEKRLSLLISKSRSMQHPVQLTFFNHAMKKYLENPSEESAHVLLVLRFLFSPSTLAALPNLSLGMGPLELNLATLPLRYGEPSASRLILLLEVMDDRTEKVALNFIDRVSTCHRLKENFEQAVSANFKVIRKLWNTCSPSGCLVTIVSRLVRWSSSLELCFVRDFIKMDHQQMWHPVLESSIGSDIRLYSNLEQQHLLELMWDSKNIAVLDRLLSQGNISPPKNPSFCWEAMLLQKFTGTTHLELLLASDSDTFGVSFVELIPHSSPSTQLIIDLFERKSFSIVLALLKHVEDLASLKKSLRFVDLLAQYPRNPDLLDILLKFVEKDNTDIIDVLLGQYQCSLDTIDRKIRKVLDLFDDSCWCIVGGTKEIVCVLAEEPLEARYAAVIRAYYTQFDQIDFKRSCSMNFPHHSDVELKRRGSKMPVVATKRLKKTDDENEELFGTTSKQFQNDDDEERQEKQIQDDEEEETTGEIDDEFPVRYSSKSLDPSHVFPAIDQFMTLHMLTLSNSVYINFQSRRLIDSGMVSFCIYGLSSTQYRMVAGSILAKFLELVQHDTSLYEQKQILMLLRFIANSCETSTSSIPPLLSACLCNFLEVLMKPGHSMYTMVNKYLVKRPYLELTDLPMFYLCFNSGNPTYASERGWMLKLILEGILTVADLDILIQHHVLPLMMSAFRRSDTHAQSTILHIFNRICKLGRRGAATLLKFGVQSWTVNAFIQVLEDPVKAAVLATPFGELLESTCISQQSDGHSRLIATWVTSGISFAALQESVQCCLLGLLNKLQNFENLSMSQVSLGKLMRDINGVANQRILLKLVMEGAFRLSPDFTDHIFWMINLAMDDDESVGEVLDYIIHSDRLVKTRAAEYTDVLHVLVLKPEHRSMVNQLLSNF